MNEVNIYEIDIKNVNPKRTEGKRTVVDNTGKNKAAWKEMEKGDVEE